MTFLLAGAALCLSGLAILDLARLRTGCAVTDAALSWFVGGGAFASAAALLRFAFGVPYGAATAAAIVLAPIAAAAVRRLRRTAKAGAVAARPLATPARWLPRPAWLFAPLSAYVLVVTAVVVLHGMNTPTNTSDGVRVRAFTPFLAWQDAWPPAARDLFVMTGAVPTYVPSLPWRLGAAVNPFDVNAFVVAGFVALLALVVSVASSRGAPERGWAGAFATASLPFLVYHVTSTYADGVLAVYAAAAFVFAAGYARTRDGRDAVRAILLLSVATLVKREGELVAVAIAAPLLANVVWNRRRAGASGPSTLALALAALPFAASVVARVAAVGVAHAFPFLGIVTARLGPGAAPTGIPQAAAPAASLAWPAAQAFGDALFVSGNPGMLYWIVVAVLAARWPAVRLPRNAWPLAGALGVLAITAVSSIWLFPEFTLDETTVHRALLPASLVAALWTAGVVAERAP